jgi:hydroxylamine reductase (hybrid-cluster protein)
VCGKTPETAALQDLLVHQVKGLSLFSSRLHEMGRSDQELDEFLLRAMFSTLTIVNFDPDRFANDYCVRATELIAKAEKLYRAARGTDDIDSSQFAVTGTAEELEAFARDHASVWKRRQDLGEANPLFAGLCHGREKVHATLVRFCSKSSFSSGVR